jgi:hypothetical protein
MFIGQTLKVEWQECTTFFTKMSIGSGINVKIFAVLICALATELVPFPLQGL